MRAINNDSIEIDGYCIAYTMTGSPSNMPIILVHGLMSHRGVWARTAEALKEDFFCIAPDLLGFGDSDKPKDGDYSIAKQAERILKVADHFGFDNFIIIGHSMGGQIATYLAATLAPQCVSKLVSVDGVVTGKLSERVQNITRRMTAIAQRIPSLYDLSWILSKWKPYSYRAFQSWFYKIKELPFDSWEADRYHASNSGIALSTTRAWDSLNAADLTSMLKNITVPTLVIFGNQDETVPVAQAHLFKERLADAQLVVIDECGHFPMYEKFEEYMKPISEFLAKKS